MGGGHEVVIEALRTYSGKLGQDVQIPNEVGRLVQQSDVGDESWGVVGLFVKNEYTEMLTDLQDLVIEMGAGLTAASEKLGNAATIYEQNEHDNVKALNDILKLLELPAQSRIPQMGPAK
ncbi:hypothetical protein GCM10027598_11180 [Amycolatopsis oliviviridis]|uniref:Excreted virulence factor EspC, type VII ESX diderm n=1 Tax=Amycolatopsis oliviviridis TaxID=1471590 RepID=A0ABQ3LV63_9PSEU|nr:type VII secretion target [Amycolatopsis oliviviridis]GHH26851.1 hypothetical protein GCM10017790_54950 [Amycolatopsis oliviviridis]